MDIESDQAPVLDEVDQNGRSKRVRKTKIRLEEEDNYLKEALGLNKKKRPKKEGDVGQFQNANACISQKGFKAKKVDETKRMSANAIAVKASEELSDRSLKKHLNVLRYFLTPKVIERLEAAEDIDDSDVISISASEPKRIADIVGSVNDIGSISDTAVEMTEEEQWREPTPEPPSTTTADSATTSQCCPDDLVPGTLETDKKTASEAVEIGEFAADVFVKQPASLTNVKMRQYQIEGLQWLVEHYQRGINCILADGECMRADVVEL